MSNRLTQTIRIPVQGMTCANCAGRVEKALLATPGVLSATVNFAVDRADVTVARGESDRAALSAAIAEAGYTPLTPETDLDDAEAALDRRDRVWLIAAAVLTTPFMLQMAAMAAGLGWHMPPYVELILAAPIQLVIGARFYVGAAKALRAGAANMDVLVAMGTSAAFFYSLAILILTPESAAGHLYFEASAVIITLVLAGKALETRAKRGAASAIRALMRLRPDTAQILKDGAEVTVAAESVVPGDSVLIRPGERAPVDGVVEDGETEFDEALVTGESLPIAKKRGDPILAGAINGTGFIRYRATAVGADSTLGRIIRLVENAQSGKAPVQRLVDRISAIFVPTVVLIAVATLVGWLVAGAEFETALVAAISVLVIACPCALGLATPTAIVAGTGVAARAGILIRDAHALEQAGRVETVVFDKTGTLTEGRLRLAEIHPFEGVANQALRLAASAQVGSEHPIARAFLARAKEDGLTLALVSDFTAHPGLGVAARVDGADVLLGNRSFLSERGVETDTAAAVLDALESKGYTAVLCAADGRLLAAFAIADGIRDSAGAAIHKLKKSGIETVLLSGDAAKTARAIAAQVGVDSCIAPVSPGGKSAKIAALRQSGPDGEKVVAMVGDGVNDAPALAEADVGIAMGTGSDVAMETAGVTLMRSDLRLVPAAIAVSKATMAKVRQNLFWAFIYNVICIPLAAFGYLTPALAGAAMALSSVSVVTNSLLLKRWRANL